MHVGTQQALIFAAQTKLLNYSNKTEGMEFISDSILSDTSDFVSDSIQSNGLDSVSDSIQSNGLDSVSDSIQSNGLDSVSDSILSNGMDFVSVRCSEDGRGYCSQCTGLASDLGCGWCLSTGVCTLKQFCEVSQKHFVLYCGLWSADKLHLIPSYEAGFSNTTILKLRICRIL